jgi:kynurenine 3-monooxygenase
VLHTLPREKIAKRLLLALQKEPSATLIFNHKLISCDFEGKTASFENINWKEMLAPDGKPSDDRGVNDASPVDPTKIRTIPFDFIFGCDGSYSNLRQSMMRQTDMDFQTSYIHAKWCDFIIPPASNGDYRMNPHNLHVWPDNESIVVAMPDFVGPR